MLNTWYAVDIAQDVYEWQKDASVGLDVKYLIQKKRKVTMYWGY